MANTRFANPAAAIETEPLPHPISANISPGLISSFDRAMAIISGWVGFRWGSA